MNARERFLSTMHFQPTDRPFRWETLGMWPETLDRWYAEGLDPAFKVPKNEDLSAWLTDEFQRVLLGEFGFDRIDYLREAVASGYTETPFYPPFEKRIIAEDRSTRTILDLDGIIKRELVRYNTSSMPQFLKFPVESLADFRALLPRLDPETPGRLSPNWETVCAFYAKRDFPVGLTICGAFGHPRNLLGVENLCTAYYDQPALIYEIMEHWLDFYCKLSSRVWAGVQFDFVLFWEDMAYRGGSLISPRLVREFMLPYYRRLIDHLRGLGCEIFIVDSDGNVTELVPLFLCAGVNAMLPFEVQSGMDVRMFRRQYGKSLAMMGGLDKRLLVDAGPALVDELRAKVPLMLASGGYIPALDHTVPPDVSLENFRFYLECLRGMG